MDFKPRTLEMFHYLGVLPDILQQGARAPPLQAYEFGGSEPLKTWDISPWIEPTPDRPYARVTKHCWVSSY